MIDLQVELLSQLPIDRLDDVSNSTESAADGRRRLVGLIGAGQGDELEAVAMQQLARQFSADVAVVTEDGQIGIFSFIREAGSCHRPCIRLFQGRRIIH